jgi:hypothetical protein
MVCAASSAQAQQSCAPENRVYNLTPTDQMVNIGEVGQLREGTFLRIDPVLRELQQCAGRAAVAASAVDLGRDGIYSTQYTENDSRGKNCCPQDDFGQCRINVQVYRGGFTCRR